ncbi:Transposase and inactivated derivatives [Kingella potus]|uniref:Transposase and inactivated derivatives n=1 Tax=Kingella potus TaxID=265175 RepID=A0A377R1V0_9NEIS|nr:transposase [Kingella potus]UOP00212.1 transposase [Kingella potus]STR02727.1 Transposase and inactivated derivatives [Kingella potus]
MTRYRRNFVAGGTFFFTVKLADPKSRLLVEHIGLLRTAYTDVCKMYPFETLAVCVMPNHLHSVWTLPLGDADYSLRWRLIKSRFSAHLPAADRSASKLRRGERGIWQRRFYEHTVRDETDLQRCADYIHFNPVRHGFAATVRDWPFSSFHRLVRAGILPPDWGGTRETEIMNFGE